MVQVRKHKFLATICQSDSFISCLDFMKKCKRFHSAKTSLVNTSFFSLSMLIQIDLNIFSIFLHHWHRSKISCRYIPLDFIYAKASIIFFSEVRSIPLEWGNLCCSTWADFTWVGSSWVWSTWAGSIWGGITWVGFEVKPMFVER
jgi:hypothetical protein